MWLNVLRIFSLVYVSITVILCVNNVSLFSLHPSMMTLAHCCLWDPRDPKHHDNLFIRNTWLEIAQHLKTSDTFLKTKWKTVRDRYRKESRKKTTSGEITDHASKCCLMPLLEFLQDSIKPRR